MNAGVTSNSLDKDSDEVIRQMKELLEGKVPMRAPAGVQPGQKKPARLPKGADLALMLVHSLRNEMRDTEGLEPLAEFVPEAKPRRSVVKPAVVRKPAAPPVTIEEIATSESLPAVKKKSPKAGLAVALKRMAQKKKTKAVARKTASLKPAYKPKPKKAALPGLKRPPKARPKGELTAREKLLLLFGKRRRK